MTRGPDAEALAERTLALCRIPSVIGDEQALADHVEAWARGLVPASWVRRVGHSLVIGDLSDPRPQVGLVGHLDTVPAHPGDPLPHRADGRVVGLGSSDMKGGLAVMMALYESLPLAGLPVHPVLVFYEREEGPFTESGLGPLFDAHPELSRLSFAIALEPTDGEVQVGCVGSLHATLRFTGRSAHSARPWQGENAIHKAGPLLTELAQRPPRQVDCGGYPFYEVMNVTVASGGRARNVIPEAFELNLNVRFAPGRSLEDAQAEVRDWVAGRAEVTFTDLAPSGAVCADNVHFQRLVRVSGRKATSKQAWTDVARLSQWGVDAVNFGPGETAQAHQAAESCGEPALGEAYRILEAFLTGD